MNFTSESESFAIDASGVPVPIISTNGPDDVEVIGGNITTGVGGGGGGVPGGVGVGEGGPGGGGGVPGGGGGSSPVSVTVVNSAPEE